MVRFCTNPAKFSVLGVDLTFSSGKYYVTATTYRHLLLRNENGVHPVRIGPVLVHNKKEASSYHELSSTMVKLNSEIRHTLAFGTDGEKAWSLAGAQHLLCDLHLRDNISSKLKDLGINGDPAKTIINDIFGRTAAFERIPGLIDADDSAALDSATDEMKSKWLQLHCHAEKLVSYFVKHKLDLIRKTMTADIRAMAGLGWQPNIYDQYANECVNSVLQREKQRMEKKRLTIPEFSRLLLSGNELKKNFPLLVSETM